jgi:hypothetical protein
VEGTKESLTILVSSVTTQLDESNGESETGDSRRPFPKITQKLHRDADRAQDGLDDAAEEQERDDRDDRNEGEDQGVFGEALSALSGKHC